MIFAFAVIFGILSGWAGAVGVAGRQGAVAVVLGLLVSGFVMSVFMVLQVGLLNVLGGDKGFDEVMLTGSVLTAALCWIWGPAFGVFYWRQGQE